MFTRYRQEYELKSKNIEIYKKLDTMTLNYGIKKNFGHLITLRIFFSSLNDI